MCFDKGSKNTPEASPVNSKYMITNILRPGGAGRCRVGPSGAYVHPINGFPINGWPLWGRTYQP